MASYQDLVDIALDAGRRAAAFIRSADRPDHWDEKGTSDFVTDVDRRSEEIIADTLTRATPDAVVVGEELTPDLTAPPFAWIVDPLDGTTNYLHGYPAYAVSIAAVIDGEPRAACVIDVHRDATCTAAEGGGTWYGNTRVHVSERTNPAAALIGTGFPFKHLSSLPEYLRQLDAILRQTSGIRRAGAAALDLTDVALGRLDGFWELHLAPWDFAAGVLLVREAGGVVTHRDGTWNTFSHGSVVAGNPRIHDWLLRLLADDGAD